jgi:AraC-like DNA-binding protein
VLAAIAHVEQAADDDGLRLADLAAAAGTSPFHFVRLFKRETGVTPYRYVLQARIRRAVGLLAETSRSVTEIAFDVGFGDLSNFLNAFRREIGCSPRQYRLALARRTSAAPAAPRGRHPRLAADL